MIDLKMRTRIQNARRFGRKDERMGHRRMKKAPHSRCFKSFCITGISPLANIPTPCARCASTPIFGWGMRTRIQNARRFGREDERMGHQRMKKAPHSRCRSIGNFACGEYSHALRLVSELPDLRAANANPNPKREAFWAGR